MSDLEMNAENGAPPGSTSVATSGPVSGGPTPTNHAPGFAAANQPSYARTLFLGPDGLRPGWGLLFYFVTFYPLQSLASSLATSRDFGASGLWSMMLEEFGRLVAAVIPAIALMQVERRPWAAYGLPATQKLIKLLSVGALWGIAAISLLMLTLRGAGAFSFGHLVLHGVRMARFAAFWGLMFLIVGLFEEFLLRGYSQYTLARGVGFWPAAVLLSCAFGLTHLWNAGEQWSGLLAAAAIGFFFCLTLRRTGNLWFAVGFHAAWDWGETFVYSVPDSGMVAPGHLLSSKLHGAPWLSGGSVGPEGSVLCFAVIALSWLAFHRVYREASFGK
jgi:membrane protease YdiL (CAAX protease family)